MKVILSRDRIFPGIDSDFLHRWVMAKIRVQFQKELSFQDFQNQFGPESQCREAVFRFGGSRGFAVRLVTTTGSACCRSGGINVIPATIRTRSRPERSSWGRSFPSPPGFLWSIFWPKARTQCRRWNSSARLGCPITLLGFTGGGPESYQDPNFRWVNTILGSVKNAIHGTYHSLREKHLPRFWRNSVIGSTDDSNWRSSSPICVRCDQNLAPSIPNNKIGLW